MSAVLPPGTESPLVCEVSEMGDTLNKTDVLLMALRGIFIQAVYAIDDYFCQEPSIKHLLKLGKEAYARMKK